jgi:hypothetical protein
VKSLWLVPAIVSFALSFVLAASSVSNFALFAGDDQAWLGIAR